MTRNTLIPVVVLVALLGAVALYTFRTRPPIEHDTTPPQEQPNVAPASRLLIFVDVTSSINEEEVTSVAARAAQVISAAGEGVHIVVIPILRDVERAMTLLDERLPEAPTSRDEAAMNSRKRELSETVKQQISRLPTIVNADTNQHRSCISAALRRASELVNQQSDSATTEIILISDMIEDCEDSLEGGRVVLTKSDIADDVKRVSKRQQAGLIDLGRARVTALIPTASRQVNPSPRPPVHQLRAYWRAILDRCADDASQFSFGADLPMRLREPSTEVAVR